MSPNTKRQPTSLDDLVYLIALFGIAAVGMSAFGAGGLAFTMFVGVPLLFGLYRKQFC